MSAPPRVRRRPTLAGVLRVRLGRSLSPAQGSSESTKSVLEHLVRDDGVPSLSSSGSSKLSATISPEAPVFPGLVPGWKGKWQEVRGRCWYVEACLELVP